ncbi:MAG TPA: UDP-glucose 4-epimerase GalE [Acidimicrobiales bacterium]|nr:UDP-glucose 4-epimerase GalE [Acidimicrobiales bacterium]
MRVLVTGAAGFIGSTTAELLLEKGHDVVALDSLATSRIENVPEKANFVEGDCGDEHLVESLGSFDACIHFAARIEPGESMKYPEQFFSNNVASTFRLLNALVRSGVDRFIFSSSCAVYGDQIEMPIDESRSLAPHSPYGQSKLMVEQGLRWLVERGRLRAASMRYFNAAGGTLAHPERHRPEIHLIPIALDVAAGNRDHLDIFGDDYPTPDGTCIRDYIHVSDLAQAHVAAIGALDNDPSLVLNLGSGVGYSNREVVETVKRVTSIDFDVRFAARRPGDPAAAVASNDLARDLLDWEPKHSAIDVIVADAWMAHRSIQ